MWHWLCPQSCCSCQERGWGNPGAAQAQEKSQSQEDNHLKQLSSKNRKKSLALNRVKSSLNIHALFTALLWNCLPRSKVYFSESPEDWIPWQTVLCAPCKLRQMGNIFQLHHEVCSFLERGMWKISGHREMVHGPGRSDAAQSTWLEFFFFFLGSIFTAIEGKGICGPGNLLKVSGKTQFLLFILHCSIK